MKMAVRNEQLRSTKTYIWYTGHMLGTGATSNVYVGRHKKTGDQVAVKSFNTASFARPYKVQERELDVLNKLKHKNIVHLLTIEEDQISKQPVIVMELCVGGSLYNILEETQNIFGLKEDEFLIVLMDVTSGMKYLREAKIVHRDIKPGNIMRVIKDDNTSIYKLTDFGAARELEDEENFDSLYGTEEYLHPDLYQRAVLRLPISNSYSAKIDLWSIGVTFYQVATGQLPFRPYGGRNNRETMIFLTTKKPNGVISGVQHDSKTGNIEWSSQLPDTCHLSNELKKLIKCLLAGLLECENRKMWSFEHFFGCVQDILNLKKVNVFNAVTSQMVTIRIDSDYGWSQFMDNIAEETRIPVDQQLICFDQNIFDSDSFLTLGNHYPDTTLEKPMILLRKDLKKFPAPTSPPRPKLPKIGTPYSLENDAPLSKMCCGVMHFYLVVISSLSLMQNLMSATVKTFCCILKSKIKYANERLVHMQVDKVDMNTKLRYLGLMLNNTLTTTTPITAEDQYVTKSRGTIAQLIAKHRRFSMEYSQKVENSYNEISKDLYSLFKRIITENALEKCYDDSKKCQPHEHCYNRFEVLVGDTQEICDQFKKDKRLKHLAYNEEQIHKMDKQKLSMKCTQGVSLLIEHCESNWRELHNRLGSWYTNAYFDFQTILILLDRISEDYSANSAFHIRITEFEAQVLQAIHDANTAKHNVELKTNVQGQRERSDAFGSPKKKRPHSPFTVPHAVPSKIFVTQEQMKALDARQKDMRNIRRKIENGTHYLGAMGEVTADSQGRI